MADYDDASSPPVLAELAGSAGFGGGERYLQLLFERLDTKEFSPLLICPEEGPFAGTMERAGVPTRTVRLEPLVNPIAALRLVALLRRERVAILQTHGARSNFYGLVAGRLAGVPVLLATLHNSLFDYDIRPARRRAYLFVERLMFRLADRIICVSDALRQHAIKEAGVDPTKVITIHNGIDVDSLTRQSTGAVVRNTYGPGPIVVSVGRLTDQKGHRYLIEAVPFLIREWPGLRCLIVGDGDLHDPLQESIAHFGVGAHCILVGVTAQIAGIVAAADVFVLPSVSEGFPFVLLEALALGKPVVASNIAGVTEIIDDGTTGLLVPPRDSRALAGGIARLLRDSDLARCIGEAGQDMVRERFSAEGMVRQTVGVMRQALV